MFFGGYFGDVLSDVYERSIELEFVIYQLRKYELHFWIKLSDFQALQILLLELPDNISIVGDHCFQKSNLIWDYSLSVTYALNPFWFI